MKSQKPALPLASVIRCRVLGGGSNLSELYSDNKFSVLSEKITPEPGSGEYNRGQFSIENIEGLKPSPNIKPYSNLLWGELAAITRSGNVIYKRLHNETRLKVFRRTYWWRTISSKIKTELFQLSYKNPSQFKNVIDHADSIMMSLLLSMSDKCHSWKWADNVNKKLISQSLMRGSAFIKERKAWQKKFRRAWLEERELPLPPDSLKKIYKRVLSIIRSEGHTPQAFFRVCMITQTRASGLATKSMVQESLEKFKRITTTPCKRTWSRDYVHDLCDQMDKNFPAYDCGDINRKSKIVFTTSACWETSKENGGKFGALQELLRCNEDTPRICLETGSVLDINFDWGNNLGEKLFHLCLKRVKIKGTLDFNQVNLATVREPAKARTITSPSVIHTEVLQPLAHVLLEYLRIFPELNSGVKKSRHLWNLYTSIGSNYDIDQSWLFESKALTFDLETSTDYGNWWLAGDILSWFGKRFSIPLWYMQICMDLFLQPREVWYGGDHVFTTCRGWLMGDPLTKGVLTIAGMISFISANYGSYSICRIVGDNNTVITKNYEAFNRHIKQIEEFDLKIGHDDLVVSDNFLYACEEAMAIPKNRYQFWRSLTKTQAWELNPYFDLPRVRLVNLVSKDREDFSSSNWGKKLTIFREINRYARICRPIIQKAYKLCGLIAETYHPPFPLDFLPYQLGGLGRVPFWDITCYPEAIGRILSTLGAEVESLTHGRDLLQLIDPYIVPGKDHPLLSRLRDYRRLIRQKIHLGFESVIEVTDNNPLPDWVLDFEIKNPTFDNRCDLLSILPRDFISRESEVRASLITLERMLSFDVYELDIDNKVEELEKELLQLPLEPTRRENVDFIIRQIQSKGSWILTKIVTERYFRREVMDEIHSRIPSNKVEINAKVNPSYVISRLKKEEREIARYYRAITGQTNDQKVPDIHQIPEYLTGDEVIYARALSIVYNAHLKDQMLTLVIVTDDIILFNRVFSSIRGYLHPNKIQLKRVNAISYTQFDDESLFEQEPFKLEVLVDNGSLDAISEARYVDGVLFPNNHPWLSESFSLRPFPNDKDVRSARGMSQTPPRNQY